MSDATETARTPLPGVEQSVFRDVVGHFTSGVTVITTRVDDEPFGTTASAVSSLSVEPPMMLICLNRASSTHDALSRAGRYAINILAIDQGDLATHFGKKGGDKFADVPYTVSPHGLPLLDGALATIECEVAETASGGTHTIFLGDVKNARAQAGEPLAYYRGRFGSLEQSREADTYDRVRYWVLRRRTALEQTIPVDALAAELGVDPSFAYNALVRLVAEGLVSRTDEAGFTPTPVTPTLVDNLYDARSTIECGVIEQYLETASDDELAEISRRARELTAREPRTSEELDEFLEANLDLHCAIVALAGSRQLVAHFRQLSMATVWRDTHQSDVWRERMGHPLIPRIADALTARDTRTARTLIRTQVDFVKDVAKRMIQQHGGAL